MKAWRRPGPRERPQPPAGASDGAACASEGVPASGETQKDPWPNIEGTQASPAGQAWVESQRSAENPIPIPIAEGAAHVSGATHPDMTIGAPIPKVPVMQHPRPPEQSAGPEHFNIVALPLQVIDGSWQRPVPDRGL